VQRSPGPLNASGAEAKAFFKQSNLSSQHLKLIWHAATARLR
jgi:hypothetical protein